MESRVNFAPSAAGLNRNSTEKEMQKLRGTSFSMVFQNPMTALNPCMSVGTQIAEAVRLHEPGISRRDLQSRVTELMELVGLDRPKERARQYPVHFSGGMAQRCVIAIALAAKPLVLFADEPTTALDVGVQEQILDLFLALRKKTGDGCDFYHSQSQGDCPGGGPGGSDA